MKAIDKKQFVAGCFKVGTFMFLFFGMLIYGFCFIISITWLINYFIDGCEAWFYAFVGFLFGVLSIVFSNLITETHNSLSLLFGNRSRNISKEGADQDNG